MEWLCLVMVSCLSIVCAYLTYTEEARRQWWFIPLCTGLGSIWVLAWFVMVRYLDDKEQIYFYSLCWDTSLVMIYYLVPVLFFNVELTRYGGMGLLLMLAGLVLLKV